MRCHANLDMSLKILPSESHDNERKTCDPVEKPLSKTEVIDQSVYVCRHDVDDWQDALQITYKNKCLIIKHKSC